MNGAIWLCKRYYMNHDVISDKYGRLYKLPEELALRGWSLNCLCLSYRNRSKPVAREVISKTLSWNAIEWKFSFGLFTWFLAVSRIIKNAKPKVLIAASDCLHIILGAYIAKKYDLVFIADLYDNYEAFGLAKIPGLKYLYRRALSQASGISTVSVTLKEKVGAQFPNIPSIVIESCVDTEIFYKRNDSRRDLSLPEDVKLIGLCGGLNEMHDIKTIYSAFQLIKENDSNTKLVIAGKFDPECLPPDNVDYIYLGVLKQRDMPIFYSAVDVVLITLADSDFGHYAFPQKAYEALACEKPIVATDIGSLGLLFKDYPESLYSAGNEYELFDAIQYNLINKIVPKIPILTWSGQASKLEKFIESNINKPN